MNIQQFQYVLAVVDFKNFERAADNCFVSQSTLSTMIGRFENEIGIKIFNRKTKPVSVTSEGMEIIARLRIIKNEIDQFQNLLNELKGEVSGELKIGVIPTVAPYLLPLFLPKFASEFPKVKIIIQEISTAEIIKSLKNRTLDVGILALPIADQELDEQELYVEPFMVYDCTDKKSNAKISINNLDYSRLWLLKEGHCLRTQVQHICEQSNQNQKSDINFEFESGSMDSLLRFTRVNNGMTIIPHLASLDFSDMDRAKVVGFGNPVPSRSVGLLTHKYFVKKKLAIALSEIIKQSVLELIPRNRKPEIVKPL